MHEIIAIIFLFMEGEGKGINLLLIGPRGEKETAVSVVSTLKSDVCEKTKTTTIKSLELNL